MQGRARGDATDEPSSFRAFFRALAPEVRGWAARAVGPQHADDVVTETFLVVWRRWEDLPADEDHRRAWVFVVARHKAAHVRTRLARDRSLQQRLASVGREDHVDVADEVATSQRARQVLRELRPEDREVLMLVGVESLSPADAAAVLGCSVTALTTRLSRARRRLTELLARLDAADETRSTT